MTTPRIDAMTTKRLAFVRLLYQQKVDQAELPEPLIFSSVLAFHDALSLRTTSPRCSASRAAAATWRCER